MRFALVDDRKVAPQPKMQGTCPHCGDVMISKCGRTKVWHWAHKSREVCDPWWENETEWHRNWKNQFPVEWQEISAIDALTGERHIADVKTPDAFTVEFQHSPMPPEEMIARESFYGNMIWVVDGLRNDLDVSYFNMGLSREPINVDGPQAHAFEWRGRSRLMHNWSEAKSRVFLDFGDEFYNGKPMLWVLICFDKTTKQGVVGPYPKALLIENIVNNKWCDIPSITE
jgi:competence protein CoiA